MKLKLIAILGNSVFDMTSDYLLFMVRYSFANFVNYIMKQFRDNATMCIVHSPNPHVHRLDGIPKMSY